MALLGYFASAEHGRPQGEAAEPPPARSLDPVKLVRDLLPKDFRKSLARLLPGALRDKLAKRVDTASIDWSRTRAFCLPTDLEGLIRVNLQGREPLGIVAPGAAYEALLDEITAAMHALTDPAGGRKVVAEVIRTDTTFPGPRRDWLPDLIVTWDRSAPIEVIGSPDGRTGTHKGPGFVLAAGPGIAAGTSLVAHILDICPTLLARHGVAPTADLEGRAFEALVGRTGATSAG